MGEIFRGRHQQQFIMTNYYLLKSKKFIMPSLHKSSDFGKIMLK